jgi:glycosyltransferase involved in cell wall biosynthesis
MDAPLVSVICLCYNHARFVKEAIESVLRQTYARIEIIVVDDASTDNSVAVIQEVLRPYPEIQFLALKQNVGNCKAFNQGLALAHGVFVVDFATDDVMMPERIEKQVALFSALDPSYGVVFTDAEYIDERGGFLRYHYEYLFRKGLIANVPTDNVYAAVLRRYFIAAPTMLVRREVFTAIGGYDETLSYEDFDFWVRSSRRFNYAFLNERLTKIRIVTASLSKGWYKQNDPQLHSTYLVCKKAVDLNRTAEDHEALLTRIRYELRQSVFSQNYVEASLFYELLNTLTTPVATDRVLYVLNKLRLPLQYLRRLYHALRY